MRTKIVAGNWKMNNTAQEAGELLEGIVYGLNDVEHNKKVIVFPPAVYIGQLASFLQLSKSESVAIGSQNNYHKDAGAYTGEISAPMLKSLGCEYGLVGHSERREYFKESNSFLAQKVDALLAHNIAPVYCCGEVLEERKSDNQFKVVQSQIEEGLFHLDAGKFEKCIVAYEPVWAIGTGETATSAQAQEMHAFIRKTIANKYGAAVADKTSILYGGSCKPANAKELFSCEDVDGGLIGGASLKANDFIEIIKA